MSGQEDMGEMHMTGTVAASEHMRVLRERDALRSDLRQRTSENLAYRKAWGTLEGMLNKMAMIEAGGDISPLIRAIREATKHVQGGGIGKMIDSFVALIMAAHCFVHDGHAELVFAMTDDQKGSDVYRRLVVSLEEAENALAKANLL
jgi:hypothetical protein